MSDPMEVDDEQETQRERNEELAKTLANLIMHTNKGSMTRPYQNWAKLTTNIAAKTLMTRIYNLRSRMIGLKDNLDRGLEGTLPPEQYEIDRKELDRLRLEHKVLMRRGEAAANIKKQMKSFYERQVPITGFAIDWEQRRISKVGNFGDNSEDEYDEDTRYH